MLLFPTSAPLTPSSDAPAPTPQPAYPPPSNAVAAQTRGHNPYAQQNVSAAPGTDNYNSYAPQSQGYPAPPANQYAPAQGGMLQGSGGNAGNPYAQQQYGQQDQYGANGGGAGTGNDFWSELTSANSALSTLQEEIQAVRTAHQQSLVSTPLPRGVKLNRADLDRPAGRRICRSAQRAGSNNARAMQEPDQAAL